jgi:hypothetical protein
MTAGASELHDGGDPLADAIRPLLDAVGATTVPVHERLPSDVVLSWDGVPAVAVRLGGVHNALSKLIERIEYDLGGPLQRLSREDKQLAVRMLDEQGAFTLRRAVEDVADAMGVSRITIYNYLNAIHR